MDPTNTAFILFFWILFLVIFILNILGLVFWIIMIVDVFERKNWHDENDKILWIVVLFLAGWIGAVIYYFVVRQKLGKANQSGQYPPQPPPQQQYPTQYPPQPPQPPVG